MPPFLLPSVRRVVGVLAHIDDLDHALGVAIDAVFAPIPDLPGVGHYHLIDGRLAVIVIDLAEADNLDAPRQQATRLSGPVVTGIACPCHTGGHGFIAVAQQQRVQRVISEVEHVE